MKTKKIRAAKTVFLSNLFPIITFVIIVTAILLATVYVGESSKEQGRKITEDSIRRTILSCYAQEGSYPPDISYLEENYGLQIDERYAVFYTVIGSNLPPDLTVIEK